MHLLTLFIAHCLSSDVKDKAKEELETTLHECRNKVDKIAVDNINPALIAIGADELPDTPRSSLKENETIPEDVVKLKKENDQLIEENKQLKEDNKKLISNFNKQEKKFDKQNKKLNYLEDYVDDIPVVMIILLMIPILTLFICSVILHFILINMYLPYKPKGNRQLYCCSYGKC